jgi:hypothetical protein
MAAAILGHHSESADTADDGLLYEFVLNSDGSTTKITHKKIARVYAEREMRL